MGFVTQLPMNHRRSIEWTLRWLSLCPNQPKLCLKFFMSWINCEHMVGRRLLTVVIDALARQAAVALVGPRQVGKTTLAHEVAHARPSLYLDLESREDRDKLAEPALFLRNFESRLVILDEVHRVPEAVPDPARVNR
jgi:hypothetical protein